MTWDQISDRKLKTFFSNISYSLTLIWDRHLITKNSSVIKSSLGKYGLVLELAEVCTLWPSSGCSPCLETHIFHLAKDISLCSCFISACGNSYKQNMKYEQ